MFGLIVGTIQYQTLRSRILNSQYQHDRRVYLVMTSYFMAPYILYSLYLYHIHIYSVHFERREERVFTEHDDWLRRHTKPQKA